MKSQKMEILGELYALLSDEWNSRTTFGKLLYPFWVARGATLCVVMLGALALVLAFEAYTSGVDAMIDEFWATVPETHERGSQ